MAFKITIHVDNKNNLMIIQNPTISSFPAKSLFEPKLLKTDGNIKTTEIDAIKKFLTTFLKIYSLLNKVNLFIIKRIIRFTLLGRILCFICLLS
ncbi:conjugal transfer protein [Carnobacterium maltaromaticum]|uniref:conjugal transfer protein n=1 Tax=Carnobacterium maltaromaticum TaxID=2751 RepID=UPI0039B08FDB